MKLELKHIQGYPMGKNGLKIQLPKHQLKYGKTDILLLNGVSVGSNGELIIELLLPDDDILSSYSFEINKCKLLLHPLSDLIKEIEVNGKMFVPVEYLEENSPIGYDPIKELVNPLKEDTNWIAHMEYYIIEQLLEWHFDIFGLIEEGLAIDINTI